MRVSNLQRPRTRSMTACSKWKRARSMTCMPLSLVRLLKEANLEFWPLMMDSISASRLASSHTSFQPVKDCWMSPVSVVPPIFSSTFLAPSDWFFWNSLIFASACPTMFSNSLSFCTSWWCATKAWKTICMSAESVSALMRIMTFFVFSTWASLKFPNFASSSLILAALSATSLESLISSFQALKASCTTAESFIIAFLVITPRTLPNRVSLYSASRRSASSILSA
mmetsp:Transcript_41382/g.95900  ORF Transcript_41382/g.95900 Transcript_41382/m.95900 type:complete len:226 (-) Transcript_41382:823-1500(-)